MSLYIGVRVYSPQRVFRSITSFWLPQQSAKRVILQIKILRFTNVECLVQSPQAWEWCVQDLNLRFLSPNPELSLGSCGASLHNPVLLKCPFLALFCWRVRGLERRKKKSWELEARLDCSGFQCQGKEIRYVYKLPWRKEKQDNENMNVFWRKDYMIVRILNRGHGSPFPLRPEMFQGYFLSGSG